MKHNKLSYLAFIAILSIITACSSDIEVIETSEGYVKDCNQITMNVPSFINEDFDTRSTVEITNSAVNFLWAANDTVGVFPNEGAQVYFPMIKGAGSSSAKFTGGGWALKPSAVYAAYYPLIGDFYLDKTKIPVNYEGQTQVGNASTAHIGNYDFMAAVASTPSNGNVNFKFEHLGCLVELNLTIPKPGSYNKITLISRWNTTFKMQGFINLDAPTLQISSTKSSRYMSVNLTNFNTTQPNEQVKVYFMLAGPVYTDEMKIRISGSEEYLGKISVNTDKLLAGHAYKMTVKDLSTDLMEWVDLGLKVKWAAYNVGAEYIGEDGNFYLWGNIEHYPLGKTDFRNKNIGDISGNPIYDVATAKYGYRARMPKESDIRELLDRCSVNFKYYGNSRWGAEFVGPNGNSIFIPAAGDYVDGMLWGVDEVGGILSSTPYKALWFTDADLTSAAIADVKLAPVRAVSDY